MSNYKLLKWIIGNVLTERQLSIIPPGCDCSIRLMIIENWRYEKYGNKKNREGVNKG